MLIVRKATLQDIDEIMNIYNWAIEHTTGTFDTEIKDYQNRLNWFMQREEQFLIFVAVKQHETIGYLALNKWSDRKAYDITAEVSFYVKPEFHGKGIGKKLLETAIAAAQETSLVSLISRISEGNHSSVHLHELFGFEKVGIMKKAGIKFGQMLDVTFMQKILK